jgi:hypothetical protein
MSKSDLVRTTRDGDQFHYLWAARRCLNLLAPASTLALVSIEGASEGESGTGVALEEGDEVIDVAEYFGGTDFASASQVRYIQLKHSTLHADDEWTMAGLAGTLTGFAKRFNALEARGEKHAKFQFVFATNRPISADIWNALEDARTKAAPRNKVASNGLAKYTGLSADKLAEFCALLQIEGEHGGFLAQRSALESDFRAYLPGADHEALLLLKDLVTRKATSEFSADRTISRLDVLRALNVEEEDLFPAVNKIEMPAAVVARDQEGDLVRAIVATTHHPLIVHADGGVGKSIFAMRIGERLPEGSATVVYDCFGNGEYRAPSHPRHMERQALVQVANELAASMYCQPLIPSSRADSAQFFRAFRRRLEQAVQTVRSQKPEAIVCVVFDASDNAEMAAAEAGDGPSFARRLLRESIPDGVRVVMLCRTHRRDLLAPPPGTVHLELKPFSPAETGANLRARFPRATEADVAEFDRLSSHNPRVQAAALRTANDLPVILRNLGPEPKTVETMIERLLDQSIARAKDEIPEGQKTAFGLLCTALAVLRPMIPVRVLADLAGVTDAVVLGMLADLGQSILVKGSLIQFRDEPTETWFQQTFTPTQGELRKFIAILRPQSATSSYVAAAVPHLLLQAGQLDELIGMALSGSDLPPADTIGRRDIERQRLHFALKASITTGRSLDATRLALLGAALAATEGRQRQTLQSNTDLAGLFLDPDQILDIVSRRDFGSHWRGSHHLYEAGMLSVRSAFHGDARSHLRMGTEWLENLIRLPKQERHNDRIEADDIAEMALVHWNLHGADSAVQVIARCATPQFRFEVSRRIARKLVDHGRLSDLTAVARAGSRDAVLTAALAVAVEHTGHSLPADGVRRAWRVVRRLPPGTSRTFDSHEFAVSAVTSLASQAQRLGVDSSECIGATLLRHLGTDRLNSLTARHADARPVLVAAYALAHQLQGRAATLEDLAPASIRDALQKVHPNASSSDVREYRGRVGAILPWYRLWAQLSVGPMPAEELSGKIDSASAEAKSTLAGVYWDEGTSKNEQLLAQVETLLAAGNAASERFDWLRERCKSEGIYTGTLSRAAYLLARSDVFKFLSLDIATDVASQLAAVRSESSERIDDYVRLSRAIAPVHRQEAKHFFQLALDVASKTGDENVSRWESILHLGQAASLPGSTQPELAYRVARAGELTYEFVARDKYFDWSETISTLARLCPPSAVAILSRWRDRDFGHQPRLLPILVDHLLENRLLDPAVAAALFCFQSDWEAGRLAEGAVAAATPHRRGNIARFLWEYIRLERYSVQTLAQVMGAMAQAGVDISEVRDFAADAQVRESKLASSSNDSYGGSREEHQLDWSEVFLGLRPHVLADLAEALQRISASKDYTAKRDVFAQGALRVAPDQEVAYLEVLGQFPEFELFHLKSFLEGLPDAWIRRQSTMEAIRSLVAHMAAKNCLAVTLRKAYQPLDLAVINRVCGISVRDAVAPAIDATAAIADPLSPESLFNLVGLLSTRLTPAEATQALESELSRLEGEMSDKDGDGPWREELRPPQALDQAVAGFVWVGLASPSTSYRWQAAHAVRALCRLGATECLDAIVAQLKSPNVEAFCDNRLVHYAMHSRQWVVIALARAAIDYPRVVVKYLPELLEIAFDPQPHVLIRAWAVKAILAASRGAEGALPAATLSKLDRLNEPKIDHSRRCKRPEYLEVEGPQKPVELHFGIDLPSYWFDKLGDVFGLGETEVTRRVEKIICRDWGVTEAQWQDDQRLRRKLLQYEDTRHSHGSSPRSDDLRFYYSYHAMFTLAGHLVDEMEVPETEDDWYSFETWMHRHSLARPDGRWIADRRDPLPRERKDWSDIKDVKEWRWSVSRDDFDRALYPQEGMLTLFGAWVESHEPRRERIRVTSALVSPESAMALLLARQTSTHFEYDTPLPNAGEREDIKLPGFNLKGWIVDRNTEGGLDSEDPWAAGIHYPPLYPTRFVTRTLGLTADFEQRGWHPRSGGPPCFVSAVWAEPPAPHRRDDVEPSSGRRFNGKREDVLKLLAKTRRSLVVQVSIRRDLASNYHDKDDDDEVRYPPPYAKFYLIECDGTITTI